MTPAVPAALKTAQRVVAGGLGRTRALLATRAAPGWAVLGTLLAATLTVAAIHHRAGWQAQVPGESTVLMQAESLAFDLDLTYSRADYDRYLSRWRAGPGEIALVSGADGRRIAYDHPFPYALYLAPFLRLSRHGFAVANALLLIAAALLAVRVVRRLPGAADGGDDPAPGSWAPLLVALLLFGSVSFAYVFRATGDLFLLLVVFAAGAAVRGRSPAAWRWTAAGALLAVPLATTVLYGVVPLALVAAAPRRGRGRLLGGLALGLVALTLVQWSAGGGLEVVATSRALFTTASGFPLVDFPAGEWHAMVRQQAAFGFSGAPRFAWGLDPLLWGWNLVYLLGGQSIGLLPYFLPAALLLAGGPPSGGRRGPLFAAGLWLLAILLWHPFDLAGGPGTIANRFFLPLYGLLWLAVARPVRLRWLAATALVAAPFLAPLARQPDAEPQAIDGRPFYVSSLAARFLPYETSQRWLPGGPTIEHHGLWVRPLAESVWGEPHTGRLMLDGDRRAELLIASTLALDVLRLDFGAEAPARIEVLRGQLVERLLESDGGIAFRLDPGPWIARHPLWWTPRRLRLYRVAFRLPSAGRTALPFELVGERLVDGEK